MAGVLHLPSSPSYEVPEFFWTVPQGCPRQPVSFLHPAMMPNNKQATSSSTGTKNNRCLGNRTTTVHTATVDTNTRTQEHTNVAGDESCIIADLFDDLNMYCENLARENQRETDASKQINAEGSKRRSNKDCVSDISEGEEEDYDRTQLSDTCHNNSLSDDGYHTEETKRANVSINSVSSNTHSSADNHDQDSDCECHSCISEQRSIDGECNSVVSEHCSNGADENCSRTLDSDDEQNGSDIVEDDHDADEESDEDSDRSNDDKDDSDDDGEENTNNDKSGDEQNIDDDDDSIIQDDDGDDEEGGWVSVDEEGNNYMPEIHHNPAYTANKWYNMPNRYIKGTSGSGNHSSYTSGVKPMRRSTPVLSRSMGTHGYNNNPAAMYDEEELELYLRCKTGFNMPIRESYAFPRKTPDDIEEIVSFWETDFQVGKTMVPKIGSWEKKGIQPQKTCNHAHYNRYMAWKRLYIKWIECNKSLDQWYEKYSWLGLDSILLFKPDTQKIRCDDLV